MANFCKHFGWPYLDDFEERTLTREEIRQFKLYRCKDCRKWFSFLSLPRNNNVDHGVPRMHTENIGVIQW